MLFYHRLYIYTVVAINQGTEQQWIFKWFLLEKICIYVFPKYASNIYVFITYKVFQIFFYCKLIHFFPGQNLRNVVEL